MKQEIIILKRSSSVFSSVQLKPKLHTIKVYKQFRSYGRLHNRAKVPETPFPNHYIDKGPVHFSKLLKPFAFTIMVSNRKQSIYVKASAHIHTYSNMLQLLVALQSFMKWHPNRGLLTV